MRPAHHPSEAVLAGYAAGALADGPSLTVSAHLELCSCCRKAVRLLEAVGGELLEEAQPLAMEPDALATALARIERPAPGPEPIVVHPGPEGLRLPGALATRGIGRRRFLGRGFWIAPVPSKRPDGWRTYLLRAPPGVAMPRHGHRGAEYAVVLRGVYVDDDSHFQVGDFGQRDTAESHQPWSGGAEPCICLVSGQGGLRAESPLLRLLQPLLGI